MVAGPHSCTSWPCAYLAGSVFLFRRFLWPLSLLFLACIVWPFMPIPIRLAPLLIIAQIALCLSYIVCAIALTDRTRA